GGPIDGHAAELVFDLYEEGGVDRLSQRPPSKELSMSDIYLGVDDPSGGLGWKSCLYFSRGYYKNGSSYSFLYGVGPGEVVSEVRSPVQSMASRTSIICLVSFSVLRGLVSGRVRLEKD
ncbi:hypothetical protein HAX54_021167, partial [Datura stramonium]|nr:hypothetical protein [Datura stramonium]